MIRNIRVLGLAVAAVMAMSAIAASAAEATPVFEATNGYPAAFSGSNTKGNEVFKTEAGSVECDSKFAGTATETSPTQEAHPTYSGCEAFGFVSATVNTESCNYKFHNLEKVAAGEYKSQADVVCPAGQSIKITASTCSAEVKAQTNLSSTKMVNSGSGIAVTPSVKGIAYTVTKDGFLCPFNGTGNKTGGEYTGGGVTISSTGHTLLISGE